MSQLFFEKEELVARFGENATLGQVFGQIEKDLKVSDEVVCQFKVNGLALDEQGEKRLSASSLGEVQTLEVHSQKPGAILGDVLKNWADTIPRMLQANDDLARDIRFKGVEGQLKNLVNLIDEAQLLVDTIISIDTLFADFQLIQSAKWRNAQKQMAEAIGQALAAFQKKDFTCLSDILEYDMGHSLQTWMELLESLNKDVTAA